MNNEIINWQQNHLSTNVARGEQEIFVPTFIAMSGHLMFYGIKIKTDKIFPKIKNKLKQTILTAKQFSRITL